MVLQNSYPTGSILVKVPANGSFCCLSVCVGLGGGRGDGCSWLMLNTNLHIYLKYECPLNLVIINIISEKDFFPLALLRYNQHTALCQFKVYNETDTHIHCKITTINLVNTSITSYNYFFFFLGVQQEHLRSNLLFQQLSSL